MRLIGLLVVGTLALSGCASEPLADTGEGRGAGERNAVVTIEHIAYSPGRIEVGVGDAVVWTNEDEMVTHTVSSGEPGERPIPGVSQGTPDRIDGLFDAQLTDDANTFSFTFEESGSYNYFCKVHPAMRGVVVVN